MNDTTKGVIFWGGLTAVAASMMFGCVSTQNKAEADTACHELALKWSKDRTLGPVVRNMVTSDKIFSAGECLELRNEITGVGARRIKDRYREGILAK